MNELIDGLIKELREDCFNPQVGEIRLTVIKCSKSQGGNYKLDYNVLYDPINLKEV